ncbi:MAG TPA: hypothetical protein VH062_30100 [Polyangiaceae bacterium]|jgi:hypothetical protein|nr:hypothetical protein [Polyangiaceae bacterium]
MSPFVVVMLPPGEVAAADSRALVTACTAALRTGQCVVDASGETGAIAVATISAGASGNVHVEVDVRATESAPARHVARELTFQDADPVRERWRSVGFAVAGLSGGGVESAPEEPETVPPPPPSPPPVAKKAAPSAPTSASPADYEASEHPFRASARFDAGPGLTRGTWRLGGALGAGYDFDDGFWGIDVLASYAANPASVSGVDVSWATFAGGASVAYTLFDVEGRLGAMFGARDVRASETDGASGVTQTRSRWLPVGIVDASLRFPATTLLGVLSGIELRRATGGTAVQSHGTYIGASPSVDFGLFVGLQVRP